MVSKTRMLTHIGYNVMLKYKESAALRACETGNMGWNHGKLEVGFIT